MASGFLHPDGNLAQMSKHLPSRSRIPMARRAAILPGIDRAVCLKATEMRMSVQKVGNDQ
jgi:hypothetical protein